MTQAAGYKAKMMIGFEATYNTTPATATGFFVPINSSTVKSSQNMIAPNTITGRRDPVEPALGNIDVSGSVVVPVDVTATGYWLKMLLGAPTTTGSATYTHIFTIGTAAIGSAFIEHEFTDIGSYSMFNGCKVNSLSMALGGDGELTMSLDVLGGKETVSSAAATCAASATTISLTRFDNFQAAVLEGGATAANITAISLKFDANLDPDIYTIGANGFRGALPDGVLAISGEITALFENNTLLNKSINGTESSIVVTLTNGANSLSISIPEIKYQRNSPEIGGSKGILVTLPFMGYYQNDAGNSAVKFTLINTNAAY